ncbi:hypothetical protein AZKH_0637 [Azoarcus sp. KH32C]|nr:hypothetical protein AZKH_0637 [Azoarcus sp. KH32C]
MQAGLQGDLLERRRIGMECQNVEELHHALDDLDWVLRFGGGGYGTHAIAAGFHDVQSLTGGVGFRLMKFRDGQRAGRCMTPFSSGCREFPAYNRRFRAGHYF